MRRIFLCVLALLVVTAAPASAANPSGRMSTVAFQDAMRKLWEEHIGWTRLYIVSFAGNLPDADATSQRLLQNQVDIGNAVKPFYGEAAGDKLTALLKQHILGAVDVLKAAKAGDKAKQDASTKAWFANADEIAAFLNQANPTQWPLQALKMHMHTHLNLTLQEASARLQGNYPADITAFDQVEAQILQLADTLSAGIIRQFPTKFAPASM
jgi:hypothetical protein